MGVKRKHCTDLQLGEANKNKSDFRDWAALPEGPLQLILQYLHLLDLSSFTKVCKSWRTFYKQGLFLNEQGRIPWLMMTGQTRSTIRRGYSMMEDVCYEFEHPKIRGSIIWGSFQDWLILLMHEADLLLYKIWLFNPFSRAMLPLLETKGAFYIRLLLSSSPYDENCVFMLVGFPIQAFWISGAPTWHELFVDGGPYLDGIFAHGCFYLLSRDYTVAVIDVQDVLSAMKKAKDTPFEVRRRNLPLKILELSHLWSRRFLVQSCNDVLIVCQYFGRRRGDTVETHHIDVYRMDICQGAWIKLKSLGDQVLFVGDNCSTSYSVKELGIGIANCIFFTYCANIIRIRLDKVFDYVSGSSIDDWGIFNLEKQEAERVSSHSRPDMLGAIWLSAPSWWHNTTSSQGPMAMRRLERWKLKGSMELKGIREKGY